MIPFIVPEKYLLAQAAGKIVRYGALLKDAETGRIVAHLQETGAMHTLLNALPSVPLNPLTIVDTVSNLASNVQLYRLDNKVEAVLDTVKGLEALQFANVALAGLGLGISVAGFAMIKSRLNGISLKQDRLEGIVRAGFEDQRLREMQDLEAELDSQLDHAEEAWANSDGGTRVWTRVADRLNDMVYKYRNWVDEQLRASKPDTETLAYLLERMRVLAATRIECLLLIGELTSARDFAMRFARVTSEMLDDLSPQRLARARAGSDALEFRRGLPNARAVVARLRDYQDVAHSRPHLIASLMDRRQDGRDYVLSLRGNTEAPMLLLTEA